MNSRELQTDRIRLEFTETTGNEFSFISTPLNQNMYSFKFSHIHTVIVPNLENPDRVKERIEL